MILNYQFTNSSMLHACSYDTEEKELTVTFMNGRDYTYKDVEKNIYEELIGAASPGKYFSSIKAGLEQK
jgi:hypothetical protein